MKNIILCADDYAITPAVSEGIRLLLDNHRLSATSAMTSSDHWDKEGIKLRKYQDQFFLGLHLTLSSFPTISDIFAGKQPSITELMKLAYLNKLPLKKIKHEINLQLDRFLEVMGTPPCHIDGHQHAHILPGIRELVVEICKERLPNNCLIRNCYQSLQHIFSRKVSLKKSLLISALSKKFRQLLLKNNMNTNDDFSGIYDLNLQTSEYQNKFPKFLQGVGEKHIVLCHPGYVDMELMNIDSYTYQRESELEYFLSKEFIENLAAQKIKLSRKE